MIRIHTGNCSICSSPIFVEFEEPPPAVVGMHIYFFHGKRYDGKLGQVIRSCECKLWVSEVPMDDPETDDLEHDARREEEPDND